MPHGLKPCPFCGAGETTVQEFTYRSGFKTVVISARVKHWCPREEGQPQSFLRVAG
jgi:hypothetical protein